jgi:hypothetical protein
MDFRLNDEQQQLAESVKKFLAKDYSFEQRKAILATDSGLRSRRWAY